MKFHLAGLEEHTEQFHLWPWGVVSSVASELDQKMNDM